MNAGVGLHGRDREREQITRMLDRAGADGLPLLLIEGAPGTGKTHLLAAVVTTVRLAGRTALDESGWVDLDALSRSTASWRQAAESASSGHPPAPVLVAWDNPQWADPRTPLRLVEVGVSAPILVVLTHRTGVRWPGLDLLDSARLVRVELGPLRSTAVTSLLDDLCRATPSADLVSLAAVAAGNPGGLVDLVGGLREEGLMTTVGGRAVLRAKRLPRRTLARIDQQLRAASGPTRHLLQVASVVGPAFRPTELTRLMRRSPASLLPAIDEALAAGLLVGADELLAFSHDLVRAAVLGSVPRSMQVTLREELAQLRAMSQPPATGRATATGALQPLRPVARAGQPRGWDSLSEHERRVARLAAKGLTNQQIASRIGRTTHAVNFHLRGVYAKMNVSSRVELALLLRDEDD